jgi:hypothetical protein
METEDDHMIGKLAQSFFLRNIIYKTTYTVEVYSIQYYVIKFVSHFRQVGGFLRISKS